MLHSDEEPISYYRVIQELNENLDLENSIVTHDAGAPTNPLPLGSAAARAVPLGCDEACGLTWAATLYHLAS